MTRWLWFKVPHNEDEEAIIRQLQHEIDVLNERLAVAEAPDAPITVYMLGVEHGKETAKKAANGAD